MPIVRCKRWRAFSKSSPEREHCTPAWTPWSISIPGCAARTIACRSFAPLRVPSPEQARSGAASASGFPSSKSSPELRDRYHAGIAAILEETDAVSLFAQAGLPTDRGLLSETFDRFFRIVLPAPREETDLAKLLVRLFPTQKEVDRFFSQTPDQLKELAAQIAPVEIPEAWEKPACGPARCFLPFGRSCPGPRPI